MTDGVAERMGRLGGESAFEVLARAKALEAQGRQVVHLEIGEPDFNTPANIVEAGARAMREGYTHYSPAQGYAPLRESVAAYVTRCKNRPTSPEEVVIVPGGKPVIFYTIMALVNAGDEVICPDPGFPAYSSVINFARGVPVPIALREENDFRLDVEELKSKITSKTKLIIINSPGNPTCGVLTPEDIDQIAQAIAGKGIYVLSDEIYDRMVYEGTAKSMASIPEMKDWTVILDGFSKTYAMTGWRLGYGVMNQDLAQHVTKLLTNSNSCVATFSQIAGVEALEGPQDAVDAMVREFKERRDIMVNGLNAIPGISCRMPKGAFYAFPNITGSKLSSKTFADRLLQEGGVAALAGDSFGQMGEGYLRFSYANSIENIRLALDRLEQMMKNL